MRQRCLKLIYCVDIQENSGELVLDTTTETAVCEPAEADVKDVEGKKSPDVRLNFKLCL